MSKYGKHNEFRAHVEQVIFESDTPLGKLFDVVLLWLILFSVLLIMLESVASFRAQHGDLLRTLEWVFTGIFTVEYFLRLYTSQKPLHYAKSFFGIVDLLAIVPSYLALFFVGGQYLLVVRGLRLLRIFRVLKLAQYLGEASILVDALRASRVKITVFVYTVLTLVAIVGTLMHLIEGPDNGFTSIPISIYWAIVTLATVGYGDIVPQTALGKFIATAVMITGYGIIAVPTGIVTVELNRASNLSRREPQRCPVCDRKGHDLDAQHCKYCGASLNDDANEAP